MASTNNQAIRVAKLEAELEAERKRSTELDQAFKKQLDENRKLIAENATLKADLRHLNDDIRKIKETTVADLQRRLQKAKDEISQERTKLEKHLQNEARSARNRETIAVMGAEDGIKRELVDREKNRPADAATAAKSVQPNIENLVNAINARTGACGSPGPSKAVNITEAYAPANEHAEKDTNSGDALIPDERPTGTTKLLSIRVVEPAAPPAPAYSLLPREEPSTSAVLYRAKQQPVAKMPVRARQKPVPMARRGIPKAPSHPKASEHPKAVRKLVAKKKVRTTQRPTANKELCAHQKCKNPYDNVKIVPEGEEIVWIECDRCSKWYHCVCVLGRNRTPRAANKFVCKIGGCA